MSQLTAPPDTIGPYTLDCLLGTGGMGEVYKAFDPRLDRWVAVKHIKAEYALKAGYRQRLEREAKTIASLDHPSIVQIFDVLQDDEGGEWIVMELVDGPTVYDMLDGGPLDLGTTLTIALDVIHGLGVAHDQGVLHRDLKSENVMVSRKGVAKILDFGLSKRLEQVDEATLSMEGKVIGTCRVMAPEQADGQDLDGRADLFSFGILLYEMVTARSPFRASTPMASMLKAFGEPHAPVHSYNPDVPQELSDLIDWLLSKNRNHRPKNALVVAAELTEIAAEATDDPAELAERIRMASRSWHGSGAYTMRDPSDAETEDDPLDDTVKEGPPGYNAESSRATRSNRQTASLSRAAASRAVEETMERSRLDLDRRAAGTSSQSRWSSMFSTAFGLGLSPSRRIIAWTAWLMAILTGWWSVNSMTRPMVVEEPKDARIMVLPFENHGPDEMAHFAAGLTDELIRELTGRGGLAVVSYRTSAQYAAGKKSYESIGDELDIGYVIEGSVASGTGLGEDPKLRITLRLVRVADGEFLLSQSLDRTASDTLRTQVEIADAVAAELGAQIFADTRIDLSTDPLALDAYFRGLSIWHGSGFARDSLSRAETYFEAAVEYDPNFVNALSELAQVRAMIFFNGDRSQAHRARAEAAVARARELAPDSVAVLLASGYYEYQVLGNLDAAYREFEKASSVSPNHPDVLQAIGFVLRRQGQLAEAIQYLERAFDLDRGNSALAGFLAESERARRAYARAERWFGIALRSKTNLPYVVGERAENLLAKEGCGDLYASSRCATAKAQRILQESELAGSDVLWGYRVRTAVYELANGGSHEAFLEVYDAVAPADTDPNEQKRLLWRKILILRELGRKGEAEVLAAKYRDDLEKQASESEFALHHALLGVALALQGKDLEAIQAVNRALDFARSDAFTGPRAYKLGAVVHALLGDSETAVSYLTQVSNTDCQLCLASYEIQADPIWEGLREQRLLDEVWGELLRREGDWR